MTIRTQREAIATYFGSDIADIDWYQDRGQRQKVTTSGNDYFAATKLGRTPNKAAGFEWVQVEDSFLKAAGWQIWKAKV